MVGIKYITTNKVTYIVYKVGVGANNADAEPHDRLVATGCREMLQRSFCILCIRGKKLQRRKAEGYEERK